MKYTKHGKRRAAERGVSEDVILKAISEPTLSFYDLSSARGFNYVLRNPFRIHKAEQQVA